MNKGFYFRNILTEHKWNKEGWTERFNCGKTELSKLYCRSLITVRGKKTLKTHEWCRLEFPRQLGSDNNTGENNGDGYGGSLFHLWSNDRNVGVKKFEKGL